jgi:hypothetical protein
LPKFSADSHFLPILSSEFLSYNQNSYGLNARFLLFCNQSGKCQKSRVNKEKCVKFHFMGSQAFFPVFFIHWLQRVSWKLDHCWLEYEICTFEVERIKNEDNNSININISCIFLQPTLFSIVHIRDFCYFFQIKLEYCL